MSSGDLFHGRHPPCTAERFAGEAGEFAGLLAGAATLGDARARLRRRVAHLRYRIYHEHDTLQVPRRLCKVLGDFRVSGRREVAGVTHVEHPERLER